MWIIFKELSLQHALTLVRPESASSPYPPEVFNASGSAVTLTDCRVSSTFAAGIARFMANDTGYWGKNKHCTWSFQSKYSRPQCAVRIAPPEMRCGVQASDTASTMRQKNNFRVVTHCRGVYGGWPTECARDRQPPWPQIICGATRRAKTVCAAQPHTVFDLISGLFAYVIFGQKKCPN